MDYINLADTLVLRGSRGLQLLFWYEDGAIMNYAIRKSLLILWHKSVYHSKLGGTKSLVSSD